MGYEMIHEIDETTRLAASFDNTRYKLEDITGDGLNVFTLEISNRYAPIDQGNFTGSLKTIREKFAGDDLYKAIGYFFAGAGIAYKIVSLRGYSQGDWAEVVVYNDKADDPREWLEDPESFDDLRRWFAGDIYRLYYQKLVVYTQLQTGATIEQWETIESAFGVPLSWDSNLAVIASELDLTELAGA